MDDLFGISDAAAYDIEKPDGDSKRDMAIDTLVS